MGFAWNIDSHHCCNSVVNSIDSQTKMSWVKYNYTAQHLDVRKWTDFTDFHREKNFCWPISMQKYANWFRSAIFGKKFLKWLVARNDHHTQWKFRSMYIDDSDSKILTFNQKEESSSKYGQTPSYSLINDFPKICSFLLYSWCSETFNQRLTNTSPNLVKNWKRKYSKNVSKTISSSHNWPHRLLKWANFL